MISITRTTLLALFALILHAQTPQVYPNTGTPPRSQAQKNGENISFKDFGAYGDLQVISGCSMTASSATWSCPGTPFKSTDVGKIGWMPGAGRTTDPLGPVFANGFGGTTTNTLTVSYSGNTKGAVVSDGSGSILFAGFETVFYSGAPQGVVGWSVWAGNLADYSDESQVYSGSFGSLLTNPNNRDGWIWRNPNKAYYRVKVQSAVSGAPGTYQIFSVTYGHYLPFTITGFTNSSTLTVDTAAAETFTGNTSILPILAGWGHDDSVALWNALNGTHSFDNSYSQGDKIIGSKGTYLSTKPLINNWSTLGSVNMGNSQIEGHLSTIVFDPSRVVPFPYCASNPSMSGPGGGCTGITVPMLMSAFGLGGGSTFNTTISDLTIDCMNIPAACLYTDVQQERSHLKDVTIQNYNGSTGFAGFSSLGNGSQNFENEHLWIIGGPGNLPMPSTYFASAVTSTGSQTITLNRTDWIGPAGTVISLDLGYWTPNLETVSATVVNSTQITASPTLVHASNDAIMPTNVPIGIDYGYNGGRASLKHVTSISGMNGGPPWGHGVRNHNSPDASVEDTHCEAAMDCLWTNGQGLINQVYGLPNVTVAVYFGVNGGNTADAVNAGPGITSPYSYYDPGSPGNGLTFSYFGLHHDSDPTNSVTTTTIPGSGSHTWYNKTIVSDGQGFQAKYLNFGGGNGFNNTMFFGSTGSSDATGFTATGNSNGYLQWLTTHNGGGTYPGEVMTIDTGAGIGPAYTHLGLLAFGDGLTATYPHNASIYLPPLLLGDTSQLTLFDMTKNGSNGKYWNFNASPNSGANWYNAIQIDGSQNPPTVTIPGLAIASLTGPIATTVTGTQVPLSITNSNCAFYTQMALGAGLAHYWNFGIGGSCETFDGLENKMFWYAGYPNKVLMTLDESGHLGLGTEYPTAPLDVTTSASLYTARFGNSAHPASIQLLAWDGSAYNLVTGTVGSYTDAFSITNVSNAPALTIDGSNNTHVISNLSIDSITSGTSSVPVPMAYDGTKVVVGSTGAPVPAYSGVPLEWDSTSMAWDPMSASAIAEYLNGGASFSVAYGTIPLAPVNPTGTQGSLAVNTSGQVIAYTMPTLGTAGLTTTTQVTIPGGTETLHFSNGILTSITTP